MGVIISEMKMPKNCVCCNDIGIREILGCKLIFSGCANCGRHPYCPLKSVDGLIEKINKLAYSETEYGIEEFDASKIVRLDDLIEIIKEYCGMEDK